MHNHLVTEFSYADVAERLFREFNEQHPLPMIVDVVRACLTDLQGQVPPLDDPDSKAGWYKYSPTPGQIGPTVILGHVDSAKYGPGIFFKLGALQPGATVEVTLTDRIIAVFTVDKVVAYPKSKFPSTAVYGNIDHPGLRVITCGGTFDPTAGSYESNIVAYATLTARHPAT